MGIEFLTTAELHAGLEVVRQAPEGPGRLDLIVRRPGVGQREVVEEAVLDLTEGLVGDNWRVRGSSRSPDGSANPAAQVTVMSARAAALVSRGGSELWPPAGDQLYLDLDISVENLPAGSKLLVGSAVLEISSEPHTGCSKFVERFGMEAARFVNSPVGCALRLRGANTRLLVPGEIRRGDVVEVERAEVKTIEPGGALAGSGVGA